LAARPRRGARRRVACAQRANDHSVTFVRGGADSLTFGNGSFTSLHVTVAHPAEATNELIVPGRHAAPSGTKSANPDAELEPAEIEKLLASERPAWIAHAQVLHVTAMQALTAVDARDIDKISEAGGAIDEACESCHLQFWYPEQQ
jgi:hypothetical protein